MMRVLLITGSFPPMRCGVGDYTFRLASALTQISGLQVGVLTSRAAVSQESPIGIDLMPLVQAWQWRELRTILNAIRSWAPDVVHVQFPTLGYGDKLLPWLLPLLLYVAGIPIVQTWHDVYRLKALLKHGFTVRFICKAMVPGALVSVRENYCHRTDRLLRRFLQNKTIKFIPNASSVPRVELNVAERESVRRQYARADVRVIVFFGFIYPKKRVELLFEVAQPDECHIVIIGDSFREAELQYFPGPMRELLANYRESLRQAARSDRWNGKATMTGFLPDHEAARIMAAADAIVLPFIGGAGEWNSSVHAGQAQGTFVLTTATQSRGYDLARNTYFAHENDVEEMKAALKRYVGARSAGRNDTTHPWLAISESHAKLYRAEFRRRKQRSQ
jgi:glycosyltransferase involved in cell wall biosynthesis